MAEPNTPIPFTVGDQERLKGIEDKIVTLCKTMSEPFSRCATNMEKIDTLEKAREKASKRWTVGGITIGGGLVLYAIKEFFSHILSGS